MIVIVKSTARPQEVEQLKKEFEAMGLQIHLSQGANTTLMGLVGDTTCVDIGKVASMDIVERVQRIQEPYKKANRKFHPQDTVVDVAGVRIGAGDFTVIAGPCSVETPEQITAVARAVQQLCCAAARLNREPLLTLSRDCTTRASACCSRQSRRPVCRLSPKS